MYTRNANNATIDQATIIAGKVYLDPIQMKMEQTPNGLLGKRIDTTGIFLDISGNGDFMKNERLGFRAFLIVSNLQNALKKDAYKIGINTKKEIKKTSFTIAGSFLGTGTGAIVGAWIAGGVIFCVVALMLLK